MAWAVGGLATVACGRAVDEADSGTTSGVDAALPLEAGVDDTSVAEAAGPLDASRDVTLDGGSCPSDMVQLARGTTAFCIDRFEAPNVADAAPLAFVTALEGDSWCTSRGKRLCDQDEWERACKGPNLDHAYPYGSGDLVTPGTCNDDEAFVAPDDAVLATYPSDAATAEAQRLYRGEPSGSRAGCVTPEGVFDLAGNVAEWVTRTKPSVSNYDQVIKGCAWSGCPGGQPANCDFVNTAHPGTYRSYESGFRCCSSPR